MMGRECGGGILGTVCIVVRVGEARLERTRGGGEITPQSGY